MRRNIGTHIQEPFIDTNSVVILGMMAVVVCLYFLSLLGEMLNAYFYFHRFETAAICSYYFGIKVGCWVCFEIEKALDRKKEDYLEKWNK